MINNSLEIKRQQGVTLLEMMITLAIAAILLTVVAPNIQSILTTNRIAAEINDTSGALQFARYTAIDQQVVTVVCPSNDFNTCSNDWNDPKIVFTDGNDNGTIDNNDELLLTSQAISASNTMTARTQTGANNAANLIRFLDSGGVNAPIALQICPNTNDAEFARALLVSAQGRVRVSADTNGDDIVENINGSNVSCP